MNPEQKRELAGQRAETYAPAPTGGVALAALCGAVMVMGAYWAVSEFYDWRPAEHPFLVVVAGAMGGAVFAVAYDRAARKNRRARRAELVGIDREEQGND